MIDPSHLPRNSTAAGWQNINRRRLLDFLLLLQLFDLTPLLFDLALLRLDLPLRLLRLRLLVLQCVAKQESATRPQSATYSGTRSRCAHRRADYRAGCRAGYSTDTGALLTRAQRLPRTSGKRDEHDCANG